MLITVVNQRAPETKAPQGMRADTRMYVEGVQRTLNPQVRGSNPR